MSLVQQMIYQDTKRQLLAGGLLSLISLVFFMGIVTFIPGSFIISIVYFAVFAITGIGLLKTGYDDLQKSKTTLDLEQDRTQEVLDRVPARMYMGQKPIKSFQAGLFDMDGESYGEIHEQMQWKHKLFTMFTALFSYDQLRPAGFTFTNQDGESLYRIEKKGGFKWRGYIQHKDGAYVAYTKDTKNKTTGKRITRYIESDQCRWSAEGDEFIGHFTVKDSKGEVWAVIKRGAIPTEAADRFERMPGYLIEWKIRDDIPSSLLAFLFLLHSRER
ncbi:hypothetical protein SAMN04487936_102196 [Halobacillus dabanensis]|uniref:Uncharacterized protein n=1 Tax=Halobacillus dabanensis TaxID=240302 RepID=A0A1I3RED3_HALDA|nr:hypothetical protein [Halobacillus dabanensis]SFJ44370.1 hypothetical protein SAMN04487936_102196 [Halobacillus dabanensis]